MLPTRTSELVGRSGRITSCVNGTNTSLSIARAGWSPRGARAMRMRPTCFCSGPLSGSLVDPSTSTARSVSARSRASAYCSLTMRGSIQPTAAAESSFSFITSTKATASSLPATTTVLVRSSTEIAISCASASPVVPPACALTCVPVRPPSCLPCAKSSRTMRWNCCAWMFSSGRMRTTAASVTGSVSKRRAASSSARTLSVVDARMSVLLCASLRILTGFCRSSAIGSDEPSGVMRRRRTCSCSARASPFPRGAAPAPASPAPPPAPAAAWSTIARSVAAMLGAAAFFMRTTRTSESAIGGSASIDLTSERMVSRSAGLATITSALRLAATDTLSGSEMTFATLSADCARSRPISSMIFFAFSGGVLTRSMMKMPLVASGAIASICSTSRRISSKSGPVDAITRLFATVSIWIESVRPAWRARWVNASRMAEATRGAGALLSGRRCTCSPCSLACSWSASAMAAMRAKSSSLARTMSALLVASPTMRRPLLRPVARSLPYTRSIERASCSGLPLRTAISRGAGSCAKSGRSSCAMIASIFRMLAGLAAMTRLFETSSALALTYSSGLICCTTSCCCCPCCAGCGAGGLGRVSSNASLMARATLRASACLSGTTRSWRDPSYCSVSSRSSSSRMPFHSDCSAEITRELVASSPMMRTACFDAVSASSAPAP